MGGKKGRVIARIEVGPMGRDTRLIVTSLIGHRSKYLYEQIYCARGQAENYIKSWKRHLASESHIMLEGQRQPDAANDSPLRLLADVDAASLLPESFAVAASPVRHTPLTSDQDRSNCRREENTDRYVAARVMSTSKPDPPPVRSTRTTSQGMTCISRPDHPEPQPTNTKSPHNVRRKRSLLKRAQIEQHNSL